MSPVSPLAAFPISVREAQNRWQTHRDPAALDAVIVGIVAFHSPRRAHLYATNLLPDSACLIGDLGFDSLALAEVVFFIEDLYRVTITNADLATIITVADLRAYVRAKVTT